MTVWNLGFTNGENVWFFFWDRLNSFTTIIRRCTHFPTDYLTLLLLFKAEKIPLCIYHIFLKHSSVAKHLVWFCNLAAVNSATVNSNVQVSVMCWLKCLLSKYSEVWYAGLYRRLIFSFRETSVWISIVAILIFLISSECIRVFFYSHSCQHFLFFVS